MTSSEWELPLDEDIKKLGKFSKACVKGGKMYIYNGKAKPITFPYNDSTNEELYKTIDVGCRAALVETGEYADDLVTKLCIRIFNALDEYVKQQAQKAYESEESIEDNKLKPFYLMKYTKGIPHGIHAAESIILGGTKPMWLQIIDGKAKLSKEILLPDGRSIRPWDIGTALSKEYEFSDEEEINRYIARAKNENLDTLYNRSKSFWIKYIDADNYHHVIGAADTILSYNVDRSSSTHYLLFVGDNETGKSNNLTLFEHLAYRSLSSVSLTPANIFRSCGSFEEGQVTILEDQIDNIENHTEKRQIYETGYRPGAKVLRNDDTPSGRKSQAYLTYGFKAFTSEKQPDSIECKAFNERLFVIKCFPGDPEYDISEVVNPAGDEEYKTQLDDLVDFRKLSLIYRMLHFNDPIPNIKGLTLKNRDKQLCKPLIRLFQGTKAVDEIAASLWKLLEEKKDRKAETIEAAIHRMLSNLIASGKAQQALGDNDEVILTNADIEAAVRTELKAKDIPTKPQTWDTEDYGPISKNKITSTVKDRFGGNSCKDANGLRGVRLSKRRLEKLGKNYSSIDGIKWDSNPIETVKADDNKSGHLDTFGTSIEGKTSAEAEKVEETSNNCSAVSENIQQTPSNNGNISNQTPIEESEPSNNVSKVSKCQQEDITSEHNINESENSPTHCLSASQTTSQFGFNPLENAAGDIGTGQPEQLTPTQEELTEAKKTSDDYVSEEWLIFSKLEDAERQSDQFLEISVSQKLFHEALESSGIDIPEIIKDMNLETVCIEKDGQYSDCYRRKGE
jgi:hypothetical protein